MVRHPSVLAHHEWLKGCFNAIKENCFIFSIHVGATQTLKTHVFCAPYYPWDVGNTSMVLSLIFPLGDDGVSQNMWHASFGQMQPIGAQITNK